MLSGELRWTTPISQLESPRFDLTASNEGVLTSYRSDYGAPHIFAALGRDGARETSVPFPSVPEQGSVTNLRADGQGGAVYVRELWDADFPELPVFSLRRISKDGKLQWVTALDDAWMTTAIDVGPGRVYVASARDFVDSPESAKWSVGAYDVQTGAHTYQWSRAAEGFAPFEVVAGSAGTLLVTGVDQRCAGHFALYQEGVPAPLLEENRDFVGSLAVAPDGSFVHAGNFSTTQGYWAQLEFFTAEGSLRGTVQTDFQLDEEERVGGLAIDGLGHLVVLQLITGTAEAPGGYTLQTFDMDGRLRWTRRYDVDSDIRTIKLAVAPNGEIYVGLVLVESIGDYAFVVRAHAP